MTAKVVLGLLSAIVIAGAGFGLQTLIGAKDTNVSEPEIVEQAEDETLKSEPSDDEPAETEQTEGTVQEGGFKYETDRFSALFPGEPKASEVDNPNADEPMKIVGWTGESTSYQVSYVPKRLEKLTLEDSVTTGVEATGGTVVEMQKITVAGGTAILAIGEIQGEQFWVMSVFVDDSDEQFILFQGGGTKDDAFFNSFTLK